MPRCKNCKSRFETRFSTLEKYCWDVDCKTIEAMEKIRKKKDLDAKKQRRELKQKKSDLETVQQMAKRVQKTVNLYVRKRDQGKQCISCNKVLKGKFDAGHYYPAGTCWALRYDLANIWGQCVRCNRDLHANLIEYRKKLILRIGQEELERLDKHCHDIRKFTKHELEVILKTFKKKIKDLGNN